MYRKHPKLVWGILIVLLFATACAVLLEVWFFCVILFHTALFWAQIVQIKHFGRNGGCYTAITVNYKNKDDWERGTGQYLFTKTGKGAVTADNTWEIFTKRRTSGARYAGKQLRVFCFDVLIFFILLLCNFFAYVYLCIGHVQPMWIHEVLHESTTQLKLPLREVFWYVFILRLLAWLRAERWIQSLQHQPLIISSSKTTASNPSRCGVKEKSFTPWSSIFRFANVLRQPRQGSASTSCRPTRNCRFRSAHSNRSERCAARSSWASTHYLENKHIRSKKIVTNTYEWDVLNFSVNAAIFTGAHDHCMLASCFCCVANRNRDFDHQTSKWVGANGWTPMNTSSLIRSSLVEPN